jgi:hypothetical protein
MRLTRTPAYPTSFTTGQGKIKQDFNLSSKYRKQARQDLDTSIWKAPAYATNQRVGFFYPSPKTLTDTYKVIEIGSMAKPASKYSIVQYGPSVRPIDPG